jgi:hypothetical protein
MAQTTDPNPDTPATGSPEAEGAADVESDIPTDTLDEEVWAPSSWDLRQGLDVAELDELPAEWRGIKPR